MRAVILDLVIVNALCAGVVSEDEHGEPTGMLVLPVAPAARRVGLDDQPLGTDKAASRSKAAASSRAQGQVRWMRNQRRRCPRVKRAATCSSR
jgi:hypothetical protein